MPEQGRHWVVDTNVAVVANARHERADIECQGRCIDALTDVRKGILCIDDADLILQEYLGNLSPSGQPGAGDAFLKWLFLNQWNERHVARIPIDPENGSFAQFPDDPALAGFDLSDRKFVAVACAAAMRPTILNAADSDWWDYRDALSIHDIRIDFLCPELMPA